MHSISISRWALSAALLVLVSGCATQHKRAPVEQRVVRSADTGSASTAPTRLPPGHENAGKPGYYTVKPGDTLIRISLDTGQNWRDLAAWNQLENPNLIEVGQVLRVVPPGEAPTAAAAVVATRPIASPQIESRGLDQARPAAPATTAAGAATAVRPPATASTAPGAVAGAATGVATGAVATRPAVPATPTPAAGAVASTAGAPTATASAPAAAVPAAEPTNWAWPASGPLLSGFDEGRRKGLAIGGKAGDPVVAAADGRVVYAGSGLRGYGNLVIIKHGGDFLTAYAHNQTLLVKEDQAVRRGQKIAEMGSSDADRVQLHFELRKQGKPIDPATALPPR